MGELDPRIERWTGTGRADTFGVRGDSARKERAVSALDRTLMTGKGGYLVYGAWSLYGGLSAAVAAGTGMTAAGAVALALGMSIGLGFGVFALVAAAFSSKSDDIDAADEVLSLADSVSGAIVSWALGDGRERGAGASAAGGGEYFGLANDWSREGFGATEGRLGDTGRSDLGFLNDRDADRADAAGGHFLGPIIREDLSR